MERRAALAALVRVNSALNVQVSDTTDGWG